MTTHALTYIDHIKQYLNRQVAVIVPKGSFDNVVAALDNSIALSKAGHPLDLTSECMFCKSIPRLPVSILKCGHICCETCVKTHLMIGPDLDPPNELAKGCPLCRKPFTSADLLKYPNWPLIAKQIWCVSRIKCDSCEFESNAPDMIKHELETCPERKVQCPGCSVAGTVDFVASHAMQCEDVTVNCISCGYVIHIVNKDRHDCGNLCEVLRSTENGRVVLPRGPNGAVVKQVVVAGDDFDVTLMELAAIAARCDTSEQMQMEVTNDATKLNLLLKLRTRASLIAPITDVALRLLHLVHLPGTKLFGCRSKIFRLLTGYSDNWWKAHRTLISVIREDAKAQ